MKTLLLAGGILLLLLGFLLLVAAVVVFLTARNKRARGAVPSPLPHHPPPRPVAPPPMAAAVPTARPAAPPAPAPVAPRVEVDATVVAGKLGLGALHGVSGLLAGQVFPLAMDGFYIGRDRTLSQVVVEDPSVSKKHVWVGVREGVVMAIDQSSTNGTYVNTMGARVGQVRLSPGDTLIISDNVARFLYKA